MDSASSNAFHSLYAHGTDRLTADVADPFWLAAPPLSVYQSPFGERLRSLATIVRSRWTEEHLYVHFECSFQTLHLKPEPRRDRKTWELWNWDVVELFLGDDWAHIERYKEFELSPQGEWLDVAIDRTPPDLERNRHWSSGFLTEARIDASGGTWNGAMRIPFASITTGPVVARKVFRANVYRMEGPPEARTFLAWKATGSESFHVPAAFGILELIV